MEIYLLIYIPFILSAYLDFVKTDAKVINRMLWFWVIVFTLFRGLRWETGTDWVSYLSIFDRSSFSNIFTFSRGNNVVEWGYILINAALKWVNNSYTFFLIVTNFVILFCYKYFCQKATSYPLISFVLFVLLVQVFPTRQPLSTAIVFLSYVFLVDKKYLLFFLFVLIGVFIHRGSLIALSLIFIVWFFRKHQVYWWVYAGLYVISFFATVAYTELSDQLLAIANISGEGAEELLESYSRMTDANSVKGTQYGSLSGIILNTIIFGMVLFISYARKDYIKNKIKGFDLYLAMFALYSIIHNLLRNSSATGITEIIGRVSSTFNTVPLFLPFIFFYFKDKIKVQRMLVYIVFIVYSSYLFYRAVPGSTFYKAYLPYTSIFEKDKNVYEDYDPNVQDE